MLVRHVPIEQVSVSKSRRSARDVESLAASIRSLGLLHPITLTEELRLVAGGNRLAACKLLGWSEIPALVLSLDSLDAELAEIDENLIRNELTALERAEHFARRKELYEAKYPDVVRPRGGRRPKNGEIVSPFSLDTAQKTGLSTRTIQHDVQIAVGLHEDTKALIRSTALADHKTELLHLARAGRHDQVALVALLLGGEARTVTQAKRVLARQAKATELQSRAALSNSPKDDSWRIIHGDCLTVMEQLPAGSFRMVFADPPYNIGIDYGEGALADDLPAEAYLKWCEQWITACSRLLSVDGSLWVLICDEWADYFGLLLRKVGLHRRSWIKWYETFGANCSDNFNRCSRHLFYSVSDPAHVVFNSEAVTRPSDRQTLYHDRRAMPGGKCWDNVWMIPRLVGNSEERVPTVPTQLPLALLEPIVLCASEPGDWILDPFAGSGTTGVAATTNGRRFVGIEKRETFAQLSRLRLQTTGS